MRDFGVSLSTNLNEVSFIMEEKVYTSFHFSIRRVSTIRNTMFSMITKSVLQENKKLLEIIRLSTYHP